MIKSIYFLLFTCFISKAFSQINEKDLVGKWKVSYSNDTANIWELHKINNDDMARWETIIEFKENKSYGQSASAPCGLDDNRYYFTGKWELENDKIILQIDVKNSGRRPNIYYNYTLLESGEMKIISIQKDKIQLQIIKNWEKKMPKIKYH